jgi:hypothetical protein
MVKKTFFRTLARINKLILPRYSKTDITRLTAMGKAVVAFRYWVLINALD